MPTLDPSLLNSLNPQQMQNPAMTNAGRYVPPSFNYRRDNILGGPAQMDWNQMQSFFLPQQTNNPFTQPYQNSQQNMLNRFAQQYGGPNRNPTVPQFGSYRGGNRLGGAGNPYLQAAQQGRRGMSFDDMFDPRMMALFGSQGFGGLKPQGQGNAYGGRLGGGNNADVTGTKPLLVLPGGG